MNIEEQSIGAAIRLAGSRMKHLHACENDRGAPGSGHIPWGEVVDVPRRPLPGSGCDRVVHARGEVDRPRRRHLAAARRDARRARTGRAQVPSIAILNAEFEF